MAATKMQWRESIVEPLFDRVVVLPIENEGKSRGGIVLPDNAKDKPRRGEVLAVGPGKNTNDGGWIEPPVAVGDIVVYIPFKGVDLMHEGVTVKVLASEDLLAVVKPCG